MTGFPIKKYYDHLDNVIGSERFLKKQGLGNEVPFFICPFSPSDSNEIKKMVSQLCSKLQGQNIRPLKIDLYELSIDLLKERCVWDQILKAEPEIRKSELKELLQGMLDTEKHLVPAIFKKMKEVSFDVLFLTGIGEVFPYIRSHNVLNNLQSVAKDKPTVIFFPGSYNHSIEGGASLQLFNKLPDDKYYRAYDILKYTV